MSAIERFDSDPVLISDLDLLQMCFSSFLLVPSNAKTIALAVAVAERHMMVSRQIVKLLFLTGSGARLRPDLLVQVDSVTGQIMIRLSVGEWVCSLSFDPYLACPSAVYALADKLLKVFRLRSAVKTMAALI
jgi:hypothetical protein